MAGNSNVCFKIVCKLDYTNKTIKLQLNDYLYLIWLNTISDTKKTHNNKLWINY